jgi:hypothetical protein
MKQYNEQLDSNVHARKMYTGGSLAPSFKQQEYSNSAYELEVSNQRMKMLQLGGSKKKTKKKQQNRKQQKRHIQVMVNPYKRSHTRKKYNQKHRS